MATLLGRRRHGAPNISTGGGGGGGVVAGTHGNGSSRRDPKASRASQNIEG
jgi:hypothetical protein